MISFLLREKVPKLRHLSGKMNNNGPSIEPCGTPQYNG